MKRLFNIITLSLSLAFAQDAASVASVQFDGTGLSDLETKTIYNYYEQAIDHTNGGEPLVIIKMNRQKPLAIVDAEHFMEMTLCQKKKL